METVLGGLAVCLLIAIIVLNMRRSGPRNERDLGLTPLPADLERERNEMERGKGKQSWSPRA